MTLPADSLLDRCEAAAAPGWSMLAIGTVLAALLAFAAGDDATIGAVALATILLAWGIGLGMLLNRPLFTVQLSARSFLYRPGRWPWQARIVGSLNRDVEGLRLAPKPCGRRRACAAGIGLWVVLRRPAVEILVGDWPEAVGAEVAAVARARRWGIPLRDGLGRCMDSGRPPDE